MDNGIPKNSDAPQGGTKDYAPRNIEEARGGVRSGIGFEPTLASVEKD